MTVDERPPIDGEGSVASLSVMATPICWFPSVLGMYTADDLVRRAYGEVPVMSTAGAQGAQFVAPELFEALNRLTGPAADCLGAEGLAGTVEHQLTLHADGDTTMVGRDRPHQTTDGVTFCYFLHRRPKAFRGGQLRIFDLSVHAGVPASAHTYRDVHPDHDTLVFFPTSAFYEVTLVSQRRADPFGGRVAVHGWVT